MSYGLIPPGVVLPYGGTVTTGTSKQVIDEQYIVCNGASIAVADYPGLFAVIGYTYGGSGANFNVPDLRGRFIRCSNQVAIEEGTTETDSTAAPNNPFVLASSYYHHSHTYAARSSVTTLRLDYEFGWEEEDPNISDYYWKDYPAGKSTTGTTGNMAHYHTTIDGFDTETAPINMGMNYLIKI